MTLLLNDRLRASLNNGRIGSALVARYKCLDWHYGAIRHELEVAGSIIGPNDLKIAAICKSRGLILVTNNSREFMRVSGLQVEDWSV